ncbi:MAG: lamin tail domain-containing protein [Deltaproteobacteria bacterium]|nr:lamin tail domain-containing protein [Deltaproteobacteria bacterium]
MHASHSVRLCVLLMASGAMVLAGCQAPEGSLTSRGLALTIHVPGDFATIQEAIDASHADDIIQVGAGDYHENLSLKPGLILMGAGMDQTVLHGQILMQPGDPQVVTEFRVTADGASGLSPDVGIRKLCGGLGGSTILAANQVEGFDIGIELDDCHLLELYRSRVRRNERGMVLTDCIGQVTDNLVLYNRSAGIVLSGSMVTIAQSTFVGNGFAEDVDDGGAGLVSGQGNSEHVHNNILVSNNAGLNALNSSMASSSYNLVWGNFTNYAGHAAADATDLSVDPMFVDIGSDDFHLHLGSRAVDAGSNHEGTEVDFDGVSRPQGAAVDMGAYEQRAASPDKHLVISEVMANPVDEDRGEFVEIYNASDLPVELAGLIFTDGDARDVLGAFQGGPTQVAPGDYAVVLDPEFEGGYGIPEEVVRVAPLNTTLGNGLSTNDQISLYDTDGTTLLAAYEHPFDPGNGVSAERVDLQRPDLETNWRASPCTQSAGRPNCAPVTLASGVILSEVMANPLDESTGEFIELYNGTDDPIDTTGMQVTDGDATDVILPWRSGSPVIPARSYAVVLDPDWPDEQLFQIDPEAVLLTVAPNALGNGLAVSDPIALLSPSGEVVDTYSRTLSAQNGFSIEKVSLSAGDQVGNWAQSSCETGSSPGRLNCVSSASAGPRKPLVITEVMANPKNEDTGEFIELYNRGIDPVDAAGLLLTDGDATDVLGDYQGGTTLIPAGGYALIVDAEYAEDYELPAGIVLITTRDTTLGSGLSISDAVRLLEANGIEVIDSFRSPFDPGNGVSAERIDVRAFDSPSNWTASTCESGSSPGEDNCAAAPAGLPKRVLITEVLANQTGTEAGGAGEMVELINLGSNSVDLAGMWLAVGPDGSMTRDQLLPYLDGATILPPGAYAVVLNPNYDDRFTFPEGTVLVTIDDDNFGSSGIATTHWVALYDADGITMLDEFRYPSDPGDGVSLYRISLTATNDAANWAATPCGSTPGAGSCGGTDVTTFTSFWVDRYADEGGIYWYQAIGWPAWHDPSCEMYIVCPGGLYGYTYRDNFPAAQAFNFSNPYADYAVVFTERSSPTDDCGGIGGTGCTGASVRVEAGTSAEVPASSQGYYYAQTAGPSLNSLDWCGGDPDLYWALPPDGILAPFVVEVP